MVSQLLWCFGLILLVGSAVSLEECTVNNCGTGATCRIHNKVNVCSCPAGYTGNPFTLCRQMDPAELCNPSPCGTNTNCEVIKGVPTCSCLEGFTGNPLDRCRPRTKEDLCTPNPCGTNANCTPGFDDKKRETGICSCPPGFLGDPLTKCTKGECVNDSECSDNKTCFGAQCVNPCDIVICGADTKKCEVKNHVAICHY